MIKHVQRFPNLSLNVDVEDHRTEESGHDDVKAIRLNELIKEEDLIESIEDQDHLDHKEEDSI
jgi:hypothetical protein